MRRGRMDLALQIRSVVHLIRRGLLMKVACSNCQKMLRVPDDRAGQRITCPACGIPMTVPAADDDVETLEPCDGSEERPAPVRVPASRAPAPAEVPEPSETKICPMCGETIKAVA